MATALTAWLTAPAPIACTSARWCSRTTPAIAPATAEVRESDETLRMSIGLSQMEAEMSTPDKWRAHSALYRIHVPVASSSIGSHLILQCGVRLSSVIWRE